MMSDVRMRFSLAAISLIAIALGSFVATKALIDDSDVTAEGPPNDPAAIRQAVANDAALARFDGTLSGNPSRPRSRRAGRDDSLRWD